MYTLISIYILIKGLLLLYAIFITTTNVVRSCSLVNLKKEAYSSEEIHS